MAGVIRTDTKGNSAIAQARTHGAGFGFGIPGIWRIFGSCSGSSGGKGGGICVGVLSSTACV